MTTVTDYRGAKEELAFFIRNNDLYTTTQRGVTTSADTGTFDADDEYLIAKTNVKNVRSVVVGASTLEYGADYSVNVDYNDSGVIKCRIAFTSSQTGDYTITYDYGDSDIIWTKFPQRETTISNYPVLAIQLIGENTEDAEINGDMQLCTLTFSIIIYDTDTEDIDDKCRALKQLITGNKKGFYTLRYVKPLLLNSLLPFGPTSNKVFQRALDVMSTLNEEYV